MPKGLRARHAVPLQSNRQSEKLLAIAIDSPFVLPGPLRPGAVTGNRGPGQGNFGAILAISSQIPNLTTVALSIIPAREFRAWQVLGGSPEEQKPGEPPGFEHPASPWQGDDHRELMMWPGWGYLDYRELKEGRERHHEREWWPGGDLCPIFCAGIVGSWWPGAGNGS
jgi:hypothetical protein